MIGAEELGLPLDEPLADTLEQRIERVEEPGAGETGRPVASLVDFAPGEDLGDRLGNVAR